MTLSLGDFLLVTVDSGEQHTHAGSGYNERRAECVEACAARRRQPARRELSDVELLPAPLDARVRHVVTENARVDEAVAALASGEMVQLGDCSTPRTPACATCRGGGGGGDVGTGDIGRG